MKFLFLCFFLFCFSCSHQQSYPEHWWAPIQGSQKKWEISPDSVSKPQVILSKRNELGLLSNFAPTPFEFKGKKYGSLEGFWQATKYPENKKDERMKLAQWPHSRLDVEQMSGFQAKRAGDFASRVMKKNKISWVSFEGKKMNYRQQDKGAFYQLIRQAMEAKVEQNPKVKEVLMRTGDLQLRPDHGQGDNPPPAWRYYQIYMEIREKLQVSEYGYRFRKRSTARYQKQLLNRD